jgi:hypothetical protein
MTSPRLNPPRRNWLAVWRWKWRTWLLLSPVWYFLSSGPMIVLAGQIAYLTGWQWLAWAVLFFYMPLNWIAGSVSNPYIRAWLWMFDRYR